MEFHQYLYKPKSNTAALYRQVMEQSDICDVTVQVGEWKKLFHWCVLILSPYFENLRKDSFTEKQTGTIKLNIASPMPTEAAILYLYGKKPKFTENNIADILGLSEFLMIPELKFACVQHINNMRITTDNCMQLLELSSVYEFDLKCCYEYIRGHLNDVLTRQESMTLTKESVIELFTDPYLSYVSSEVRFSYLVNWSKESRMDKTAFREVFECIDLEEMGNDYLEENVFYHPLVPRECKTKSLNASSKEHMVLIFSSSVKDKIMTCFDLDKQQWCGIESPPPDFMYLEHRREDLGVFSNLSSQEIYRITHDYIHCDLSIYIYNLQSKQTAFIEVSVKGYRRQVSCMFTDGDIIIGVTHGKTLIERISMAIESGKKNKYEHTSVVECYSYYEHGYRCNCLEEVSYSTFCLGRLESPLTEIDPVVTIPWTNISSCCINSEQLAGLLSKTERTLFIYDIANCLIDEIRLYSYIDFMHIYKSGVMHLVPSDKGFILYNMKLAVIISCRHDPAMADKYLVQTVELEFDSNWKMAQYFYCDAVKSWFRFLKRSTEDEIELSYVSHEHLKDIECHELVWTNLPLPENCQGLSGSEQAFVVRMNRSLLNCHLSCPHCDALKAARNSGTSDHVITNQIGYHLYDSSDDDYTVNRYYARASVYDDMSGYDCYSSD